MEQIQYIVVSELKKEEQAIINDLCTEYYPKIKRILQNDLTLKVRVKSYNKGGKSKYSIHCHAEAPTKEFESEKADWDLARTLHKVFNALMAEIEHAFHDKGLERRK